MFATCSTDKQIHVCRLGDVKPHKTFVGHTDEVGGAAALHVEHKLTKHCTSCLCAPALLITMAMDWVALHCSLGTDGVDNVNVLAV
jgi:hypothetical protein